MTKKNIINAENTVRPEEQERIIHRVESHQVFDDQGKKSEYTNIIIGNKDSSSAEDKVNISITKNQDGSVDLECEEAFRDITEITGEAIGEFVTSLGSMLGQWMDEIADEAHVPEVVKLLSHSIENEFEDVVQNLSHLITKEANDLGDFVKEEIDEPDNLDNIVINDESDNLDDSAANELELDKNSDSGGFKTWFKENIWCKMTTCEEAQAVDNSYVCQDSDCNLI